jgi:hypothetical protein
VCYEEFIPRLGSLKMVSLHTETLGAGPRMLCGIHCVVHKRQLINGVVGHNIIVIKFSVTNTNYVCANWPTYGHNLSNTPQSPIPGDARSKAWVWVCSLVGFVGSNPTGVMDVYLL